VRSFASGPIGLLVLFGLAGCSGASFEVPPAQGDGGGDTSLVDSIAPDASPQDTSIDAPIDTSIDAAPDTTVSDTAVVDATPGDGGGACDPSESPGATALFVDVNAPSGGDGSRLHPFAKIADAMSAANTLTTRIALAPGRYQEAVDFKADGVMLEGGWTVVGTAWTRDCSASARTKTVVASPAPIAVFADSRSKRSGLRTLTVATKPTCGAYADGAAESCVGVYVLNGSAPFVLRDVDVVAGDGGDGALGANGVPGTPGATAGACKCSTGANGADGGTGGNANPGGWGGPRGFTPGNGKDGVKGGDGQHGTAGGDGKTASCTTTCTGDTSCLALTCTDTTSTVTSGAGACGCGALAGQPGKGGGGGGASIGVLVSGSSALQVELHDVSITAASGGDGAPGGASAKGADGSIGLTGPSANCPSGCVRKTQVGGPCGCFNSSSTTLVGGTAGGQGGSAGSSGGGGGGAGGASVAIANLGGATVSTDATTTIKLAFGAKGKGANGAPDGVAGEHFP
jgi:hypothetical protein